jgi:IclR family transcriptional regulator, acetate operon repressor
MTQKTTTSVQFVPVLDRALSVLEHLLQFPDGLGVSDLSHQLSIPKNTVYRIVNTLHERGYVRRDEVTKRFMLSRKLLTMAYSGAAEKSLMENALDVMRDLRDEVRETVLITVLSGSQSMVLEQTPGLYPFRFVVEPGTRRSIHASSHGKATLAFLPAREQKTLLEKLELTAFTPRTITTRKTMRDALAEIAGKGYAFDLAEESDGVHCVSAPILNQHAFPVAALTTTGPAFRMDVSGLDDIGLRVKYHADRISRRLGHGLIGQPEKASNS